ncbi:MAG: Asp-tRNA(Asn)/Glu-tRNA(Gln) amidotransferase subunit GatC [Actinomycetota bacterium]|nr:Asp-tRNA(Asn)/Glu-tRNA(Gln) amidotransferase subunit GatC [Actinomycetota bacterium]
MGIKIKDVEKVARLSRLALTAGELETYSAQLAGILEYVNKLNEADTKDVPPTSHVLDLSNVTRPDKNATSMPNEEALANAPDPKDGFYRVPKIIE